MNIKDKNHYFVDGKPACGMYGQGMTDPSRCDCKLCKRTKKYKQAIKVMK